MPGATCILSAVEEPQPMKPDVAACCVPGQASASEFAEQCPCHGWHKQRRKLERGESAPQFRARRGYRGQRGQEQSLSAWSASSA